MNKKLGILVGTTVLGVSSLILPAYADQTAGGFNNQRATIIGVAGGNKGGSGDESFLTFIQNAVNWILGILGLITIIILIWGGFQMVTAAGDDGKYKKGFTIVKQAVVGLILIGVSALIVNLIFSFVSSNAENANGGGGAATQ